jgi:hypothetical protein
VGTTVLWLGGFSSWCGQVVVVLSRATNSEEFYRAILRANEQSQILVEGGLVVFPWEGGLCGGKHRCTDRGLVGSLYNVT